MILKKLKRTSFKKPKSVMIGGLVDYILQPLDEKGNEKIAYYGARNFLGRSQAAHKEEMIELASESIRSPMPVAHWIMSWQENEQPSHEQIDEAVDIFLQRMGLEGHQAMYALHKNTGHCHVHIVVNRTHPGTLKVIQPYKGFDIEEAHRIVAYLVHTQGWAAEGNARYRVNQDGEIVRNMARKVPMNPSSEAMDFENATGEKSAQRIAQEKGHSIIKSAKTWQELHEALQKVGLRFEKKGSGAVVFVGEIAVKSSSIDRNFGLSKLCKRLGDFVPGHYAPEMKTPEPEPVSSIALDEWREYRALKKMEMEDRSEGKKQEEAVIFQAKIEQREHRHFALTALARHGLSILNLARHFLKVQQRKALQQLREELPKRKESLPNFLTWLKEHNFQAAGLWKFRRRIASGMDVQSFEFAKIGDMASPYMAYREMIQKLYPEKMDASRIDAMIALRMRVAGYTRHEVADEMYRKARPLRQESRDWKHYGHRMVWYAFGPAGDIDIAAFKPTPEKILSFHQEAESLEAARLGETVDETPRIRMR